MGVVDDAVGQDDQALEDRPCDSGSDDHGQRHGRQGQEGPGEYGGCRATLGGSCGIVVCAQQPCHDDEADQEDDQRKLRQLPGCHAVHSYISVQPVEVLAESTASRNIL